MIHGVSVWLGSRHHGTHETRSRFYATDLMDGQWALIAPLIPEASPGERQRKARSRKLVNAILYFFRAGMAWRLLGFVDKA